MISYNKILTLFYIFFFVVALWELAQEADFTDEELDSLRDELKHFQVKITKFKHLEAELKSVDQRHKKYHDDEEEDVKEVKTEGRKIMDKKLIKHQEVVEGLQRDLELKIAARHSEL